MGNLENNSSSDELFRRWSGESLGDASPGEASNPSAPDLKEVSFATKEVTAPHIAPSDPPSTNKLVSQTKSTLVLEAENLGRTLRTLVKEIARLPSDYALSREAIRQFQDEMKNRGIKEICADAVASDDVVKNACKMFLGATREISAPMFPSDYSPEASAAVSKLIDSWDPGRNVLDIFRRRLADKANSFFTDVYDRSRYRSVVAQLDKSPHDENLLFYQKVGEFNQANKSIERNKWLATIEIPTKMKWFESALDEFSGSIDKQLSSEYKKSVALESLAAFSAAYAEGGDIIPLSIVTNGALTKPNLSLAQREVNLYLRHALYGAKRELGLTDSGS